MSGLFDWLTEGVGSSQGPAFEGSLMPGMGPDTPPMPPNAAPPSPDPAVDTPPPMPGPAAGIPVPTPRPEGLGAPPPPVPMPVPRPSGAGPSALPPGMPPPLPPTPTGQSALPPNATPTSGTGMPPGPLSLSPAQAGDAYNSYRAAGGGGPVKIYGSEGIEQPGASGSFIGRALGLDPNKERSMWGSLGAGLTAAGNSQGKSKGQALMSGAGGALEGGAKTDDKAYDQRLKALTLAVSAQSKGDTAEANRAYTAYLKDRDAAKMTPDARGGAWNKPDSQKYIDAKRMVQQDKEVGTLAKAVEQATKDGDVKTATAKGAELKALVQQKENAAFGVMGMSPRTIATLQGNPPGTSQNPHQVATEKELNLYVKPGEHYVVPAGPHKGEIFIREDKDAKGGKPAPEAASPAPQAASSTPDTPPMPPPPFKNGREDGIGTDPEDAYNGI